MRLNKRLSRNEREGGGHRVAPSFCRAIAQRPRFRVEMQNGKHVAAIFAFCSRDAYATFPVAAMPTAALPAPRRLWQRPHAAAPRPPVVAAPPHRDARAAPPHRDARAAAPRPPVAEAPRPLWQRPRAETPAPRPLMSRCRFKRVQPRFRSKYRLSMERNRG